VESIPGKWGQRKKGGGGVVLKHLVKIRSRNIGQGREDTGERGRPGGHKGFQRAGGDRESPGHNPPSRDSGRVLSEGKGESEGGKGTSEQGPVS